MSFNVLPSELVLLLANHLPTRDLNSLTRVNRSLEWLLTPLLYDRTLQPPDHGLRQRTLCWASRRGYQRPIELLLDRGAELTSESYHYEGTPLRLAIAYDHIQIVRLFMSRFPETFMKQLTEGEHGYLPLYMAVRCGHRELVEFLLPYVDSTQLGNAAIEAATREHGDIVTLLLSHMDTDRRAAVATDALVAAVQAGKGGTLAVLIAAGCNVNTYMRAAGGETVMHCLAKSGCIMEMPKYKQINQMATVLLANGANAGAATRCGTTPLHLAVQRRPRSHCGLFNHQYHLTTQERRTMHALAQEAQLPMVELLVKAGADVNARDHQGKTPLHLAVRYGNDITVQLLLDLGAETRVKDEEGKTAVYCVKRYQHDYLAFSSLDQRDSESVMRMEGVVQVLRNHERVTLESLRHSVQWRARAVRELCERMRLRLCGCLGATG